MELFLDDPSIFLKYGYIPTPTMILLYDIILPIIIFAGVLGNIVALIVLHFYTKEELRIGHYLHMIVWADSLVLLCIFAIYASYTNVSNNCVITTIGNGTDVTATSFDPNNDANVTVNYFYTIYSTAHYTSIYGLVILALNLYIRLDPPVHFEMLQGTDIAIAVFVIILYNVPIPTSCFKELEEEGIVNIEKRLTQGFLRFSRFCYAIADPVTKYIIPFTVIGIMCWKSFRWFERQRKKGVEVVVSDSHHFARRLWILFVVSHLPLMVLDIVEILTQHFKRSIVDCDNSIPCNYYKNFCLIFLCLYSSSKFAVCCTVEHFRKTLWEILRYWKKKIRGCLKSKCGTGGGGGGGGEFAVEAPDEMAADAAAAGEEVAMTDDGVKDDEDGEGVDESGTPRGAMQAKRVHEKAPIASKDSP